MSWPSTESLAPVAVWISTSKTCVPAMAPAGTFTCNGTSTVWPAGTSTLPVRLVVNPVNPSTLRS